MPQHNPWQDTADNVRRQQAERIGYQQPLLSEISRNSTDVMMFGFVIGIALFFIILRLMW